MLEQVPDAAIALQAGMPDQLRLLPSFLREKARVMRVVASESRISFLEYVRTRDERRAAKQGVSKKQAVLGVANAAFLYGDDAILYSAYDKGQKVLPDSMPGNGKEAILASTVALASIGFNRYLSHQNQKHLSFARPPIGLVSNAEMSGATLSERIKANVEAVRDQLGSLAASLTIGVPANAMSKYLSPRQVNVHSVIYGTVATGAYAGIASVGALDNPLVYGGALAGLLGSRYIDHVFDQEPRSVGSQSLADALTVPVLTEPIHISPDQIAGAQQVAG